MKLTTCVTETQFQQIETLYLSAFPSVERKPFSLLRQKSQEGQVEILAIESLEGDFLGLAITVLHQDLVLLDYFAIAPIMRGRNIGSKALGLLKERYSGRRLLLEIEDTEEEAENKSERIRRKEFYLRNQMIVMSYLVELFGVKMQILTSDNSVSFEEYHSIYSSVFSREISQKITLL